MAYYNEEDEEQQPGVGGAPQTSVGSGQIGGSSSVGGSSQSQASGVNAPDKSGSFVGVKSYLDANRVQSERLGDKTAQKVSQSADDARGAVSNLNNTFNNQVQQNTLGYDQAATDLAKTNAEQLDNNQKAQIKKQFNASYTGPQNVTDLNDDYVNTQSTVNAANQNLANSQTEEGRKTIIKSLNPTGQYRGTGNLDNLLLQAGGGRDKLQNVVNANKDVGGLLGQSSQAAQAQAKSAADQAAKIKADTRGAIGQLDDPSTPNVDESVGAFGDIQKYLRGQATAANTQRDAIAKGVQSLKDDPATPDVDESAQLSPEVLSALGINAGDQLYDVDVTKYLNPTMIDANEKDFINQDQLARYNALNDIASGPTGYYGSVGAGYNPLTGNSSALKEQIGARKADADKYQNLANNEGKDLQRLSSDFFQNAWDNVASAGGKYAPSTLPYDPQTQQFLNKIKSVKSISDLDAVRAAYDKLSGDIKRDLDRSAGGDTQVRIGGIKGLLKKYKDYANNISKYKSDRKASSK